MFFLFEQLGLLFLDMYWVGILDLEFSKMVGGLRWIESPAFIGAWEREEKRFHIVE